MDKFRNFLLPVLPALAGPVRGDVHRAGRVLMSCSFWWMTCRRSHCGFGESDTVTPNIDSLCNEGTVFTDAYTSGALCGALSMPSRAMLMTGRHLFEIQSDGLTIPASHVTMPEYFRAAGYRTFATGKWHSDKASFARSFPCGDNIFFGGMHPYEYGGHTAPHLYHFDPSGKYDAGMFIGDRFSSEMFADAAISFIEKASKEPAPFRPMWPFLLRMTRAMHFLITGRNILRTHCPFRKVFFPRHPFDNGELAIRDEMILPPPRTPEQIKKEMSMYYGMVR